MCPAPIQKTVVLSYNRNSYMVGDDGIELSLNGGACFAIIFSENEFTCYACYAPLYGSSNLLCFLVMLVMLVMPRVLASLEDIRHYFILIFASSVSAPALVRFSTIPTY